MRQLRQRCSTRAETPNAIALERESSIEVPAPAEERELVRRLRDGDGSALKRLLRLYWEGIVRYTLHIIENRDQAEDIAQEAFIRLWIHRNRWRRSDTLRPILYRIARNLALNEVRRRGAFRRWVRRSRPSPVDPSPGPLQDALSAELDAVVRRAVDSLPERRREIFILVRFHHMSHRDAGEVLGISTQTVANQMSLALTDLHHALDPHLGDDSSRQIDFPRFRSAAHAGRPPAG